MSARYSVLLVLALIVVHLDTVDANKCYHCRSPSIQKPYDPKMNYSLIGEPIHPKCEEGSTELMTCEGAYCGMRVEKDYEGEESIWRGCTPYTPSDGCTIPAVLKKGFGVYCICAGDLCNVWDVTKMRPQASSTRSLLHLIAIPVVAAYMITHF